MKNTYIKDFDKWNIKAKEIESREFNNFFYSREIWWCALGVNIGSEQDGKNESFERPVLILKRISQDSCIILPFTSKIIENNYRVNTESTGVQAQVILSQIKTISSKRLLRKIGKIRTFVFYEILIKLSFMILGITKDETPP